MPALTTHCLYGEKIALNCNCDYLTKVINKYKQLYYIGCQGPDILFFYHKIPYLQSNGKEVNKIGSLMHNENINELFTSLLSQTYQSKDERMIAYLCGFIAHHCLDSQAHPYIFYRTGSAKVDTGYKHVSFEGEIDGAILDHFKIGRDEFRCDKLIKHNKKDREVISTMLSKAIKDSTGKDVGKKVIADCCKDLIMIEKMLYDPKGKKSVFLTKLENKLNAPGLATSMLITMKYDDKLDCLNYRHDNWSNPCDNTMITNKDFLQMGQDAVDIGVKIFKSIEKYLDGQIDISEVINQINNRSFETGLPTKETMKYFAYDLQ